MQGCTAHVRYRLIGGLTWAKNSMRSTSSGRLMVRCFSTSGMTLSRVLFFQGSLSAGMICNASDATRHHPPHGYW